MTAPRSLWTSKPELEVGDDVREDITDCRAKQRQDDDDDDGDQYEDQSVLNETLTFFTRHI